MGPLLGSHAVSYSLWVKTVSSENQLLINTGSIWSKELKHFFNLNLNNGAPEVMVSNTQWVTAEHTKLNDGQWHQISAGMPADACNLSEVKIYVDGRPVKTRLSGSDLTLHFNQAVRLGIGGLNYSNPGFDKLPVKPFVGAMDEIAIWTRPLD